MHLETPHASAGLTQKPQSSAVRPKHGIYGVDDSSELNQSLNCRIGALAIAASEIFLRGTESEGDSKKKVINPFSLVRSSVKLYILSRCIWDRFPHKEGIA